MSRRGSSVAAISRTDAWAVGYIYREKTLVNSPYVLLHPDMSVWIP